MTKLEGPQIMAAILALALIAIVVVFLSPISIDKVIPSAITGIGMLGMKLLEKNGS